MKYMLCNLFLMIIGFVGGIVFMIYRCGYILENRERMADKYFSYFNLLDKWLIYKERNYEFADYFYKNDIKSVAIYGMGKIGKHLRYELERAGMEIAYVIDEGESALYGKDAHYNLRDNLPIADAVIVTPVEEFEEIKDKILDNNRMLKVISLKEVLDGI